MWQDKINITKLFLCALQQYYYTDDGWELKLSSRELKITEHLASIFWEYF